MDDCVFQIKNKDVVTRRIAGETIIVPLRSGVGDLDFIYTLNQPGTVIWDLLDAGTSVRKMVDAICREFDVSEDAAARDIEEFLDSLQAAGLIRSSLDSGG
jgi:Coenzyme PQQ synthesis protein D (PqqD)